MDAFAPAEVALMVESQQKKKDMARINIPRKISTLALAALTFGALSLQADPLVVLSYEYSKPPAENYPDPDRSKLTDGQTVSGAEEPSVDYAVGWIENPTNPDEPHPAITFDLGEMKYIDEIVISYVLWPSAGVRAPKEVRVSYSYDGEAFLMEDAYTGFDGSEDPEASLFSRELSVDPDRQAARFVRLDFRQGGEEDPNENRSVWHWFDEVTFHGAEIDDLTGEASSRIYTAVELEFPTEVGRIYQVQGSQDLEEWEDIGDKILGNGEPYQLFQSTRTEDRKFFRVLTEE